MDSIFDLHTDYSLSCLFTLENIMERLATAYYKEKRRIEHSLLPESIESLTELEKEYNRLAHIHFLRCGQYCNFPYYVIPAKIKRKGY